MKMDAQVIVVGGGPAGATAAHVLGAAGIETLVLDRAEFPRKKPCGGGIPLNTRDHFDFAFPRIRHIAPHHRRYFAYGRERTLQSSHPLNMVDRELFDHELLQGAVAHESVSLRTGVNVRAAESDELGVSITARDGQSFRANWVIGADGANSKIARSAGLQLNDRPAVALDIEIKVPEHVWAEHRDYATFHFGVVEAGYAWIFPKENVLSCGIGSWVGDKGLQAKLDEFLEHEFKGVDYEVVYRAGQALPLYSGARKPATGRTLLVGDAAGMVDPVFGEGIRYAMLSGKLAAQAIIDSDAGGSDDAAARYEDRTFRTWGERFGRQRELAFKDLIEAPEFFYRMFIEKGVHYDSWYDAMLKKVQAKGARATDKV